ncbi:MAG: 3'-5' exonuclease, partial [Schleiferiaceae bacterium]|nr:3'-5' exonuclease [Schleiferiaceae bacterium]
MYLVFDTETTGLPRDWNAPLSDLSNWPRVVQLAWQLHGQDGELIEARDYLICPEGFNIPFGSQEIHGISTELARAQGHPLTVALDAFQAALSQTSFMVGHNLKFDLNVLGAEFLRIGLEPDWMQLPVIDTMTPQTAALVGIPGRGGFKPAKLTELHSTLFNAPFVEAHNATADVEATARCFWELTRRRHWQAADLGMEQAQLDHYVAAHPQEILPIGIKHRDL